VTSIKTDKISYTDSSGSKTTTEFELFNVKHLKEQTRRHMEHHIGCSYALHSLPVNQKLSYYWKNMFFAEKMIANSKQFNDPDNYPYLPFNPSELKIYEDYNPILTDEQLLYTNSFDFYKDNEIVQDFREVERNIKAYVESVFPNPETVKSLEDKWIENLEQADIFKLFDKCLQNSSYELTREEKAYQGHKYYTIWSSRWVINKLMLYNLDTDTLFNRYEQTLTKNFQPIYKLCSIFNYALGNNNITDEEDLRVMNLNERVHQLIENKLANQFEDWFNKKHLSELKLHRLMINNDVHFHTGNAIYKVDE